MPEDTNDTSFAILIESYGLLRDEVVTRIQLDDKRFTRGMTAIAAVVGYGLVSSENRWIVALSPFILGFLYLEHLRSRNQIAALANHLLQIENRITENEPLFRWETAFGGYFAGGSPALFETSWRRVPSYLMGFGAIVTYVFLVYLSVVSWPTNPPIFDWIEKVHLLWGYAIHATLLLTAVVAHIKHLLSMG